MRDAITRALGVIFSGAGDTFYGDDIPDRSSDCIGKAQILFEHLPYPKPPRPVEEVYQIHLDVRPFSRAFVFWRCELSRVADRAGCYVSGNRHSNILSGTIRCDVHGHMRL